MIIETKYGKIEGITENGCHIFKGIPYAKPPIGELRFQRPQKPDVWGDVYKADHFRNKSMQGPTRPGFYKKEFYDNPEFETLPSEDSLYLNIWVPANHTEEKLPVAVYVHGGAFLGGAGSNLPFVCDRLAQAGVIVVTINYRLGGFGFLCHPLLAVEGENEAGGNYGLWDQLAAFEWVKENIECFGGDQDNITVFGQSAGAMSLQALATAKKASGIFHKMILQSGGGYKNPLAEYRSIKSATIVAEDVFEALGLCKDEWMDSEDKRQEAIHRLQEASSEEMMQAMGVAIAKSFEEKRGMPFVPVIDGELIVEDGEKQIENGNYQAIPYLIGANADDITTEGQTVHVPENNKMLQAAIDFANQVNEEKGLPAYVYYFNRKLPGDDSGAFHSAELWYVFGSLEYCWRPMGEADYALSDRMIHYWSNFMKTGNPNGDGKTDIWKPCTKEDAYFEVLDVAQK